MSEEKKQDTRNNLTTNIMNSITVFPKDLSKIIADYTLIFPQFADLAMATDVIFNEIYGARDVADWVREHLIITPTRIQVKKLSDPWIFTLITPNLSIGFNMRIRYHQHDKHAWLILDANSAKCNMINVQRLFQYRFTSDIEVSVNEEGENVQVNIWAENKTKLDFSILYHKTVFSSHSFMIGCGYLGQIFEIY